MTNAIRSILDNDKYKFTMQQAVLEKYPDADVKYVFNNRRPDDTFTQEIVDDIQREIDSMQRLILTAEEYTWLKEFEGKDLKPMYIEYLRNYHFNPAEVNVWLDDDQLKLEIEGKWHSTILWEVPLMAIISECYFRHHPEYKDEPLDMDSYYENVLTKREVLTDCDSIFADFGTRRRFNHDVQDLVVDLMSKSIRCVGTSNMYLAMKHGIKAIGTQAHEWIMGVSALEGLRYANRSAMKRWGQVYNGRLGIALTDTYGLDDFLKYFDDFYARLYDGVRHDSGDPFAFTDKIVEHYVSLGIDPTSKTIVFSDGLNPQTACKISTHCHGKIKCSFGIGTNFTNDTGRTTALNMVIKLRSVDGIEVVKLSDNPAKAIGEENALCIAMNIFHGHSVTK